jgi:kynurenine formamidase
VETFIRPELDEARRIAVCVLASLALITGTPIAGQTPSVSRWGPEDQRGAANLLTTSKVLEAARLIRAGTVYPLGRPYTSDMPFYGDRKYRMSIKGHRNPPAGTNRLTAHTEWIEADLGQIGTQFDGLGHIGVDGVYYNGFQRREFATDSGLTKLGVERAGVFITRGLLVDVAALKGVQRLEKGYEITEADLRQALRAHDLQIHPGDAVILHTGWGSFWKKDNVLFASGKPGLGKQAARFLAAQQISIIGTDAWGPEAIPPADTMEVHPVHQILIAHNGIYVVENLDTSALVRDRVYEFAFICTPLPLVGASGSPVNPVAVR